MEESAINPIIYPVMICLSALAVALFLVAFSMMNVSRAIRKRRTSALRAWKQQGKQWLLPPTQAGFLNEARSFGVGNNGTLMLTAEALHFAQVMPERDIVIALADIDSVHLVNNFNGRLGGGPYLVVRRKAGDLTGFQLNAARRWATAIDEARMGELPLAEPATLSMAS
jgi:hypothetical protein